MAPETSRSTDDWDRAYAGRAVRRRPRPGFVYKIIRYGRSGGENLLNRAKNTYHCAWRIADIGLFIGDLLELGVVVSVLRGITPSLQSAYSAYDSPGYHGVSNN